MDSLAICAIGVEWLIDVLLLGFDVLSREQVYRNITQRIPNPILFIHKIYVGPDKFLVELGDRMSGNIFIWEHCIARAPS